MCECSGYKISINFNYTYDNVQLFFTLIYFFLPLAFLSKLSQEKTVYIDAVEEIVGDWVEAATATTGGITILIVYLKRLRLVVVYVPIANAK